ncbi:MAG: hypothetical protein ACKO96_19155, partial [Flammeovirgaceae bacterium]
MKLPPIPSNINDGMYGIHTRKSFIEDMEIINNQVFCLDKPINDKNGKPVFVDGETFRALSFGFFADKNYAYGLTDIQKSHSITLALTRFSMDIDSFETINMEYARDKYNTYYCDGAIKMEGTDYTIMNKDVALGKLNEVKEMSPTNSW